jgi:amidophosphoribosyltransferase
VLVDDSIVRGNTTRQIVSTLLDAGAAEVHVRISSPPILWPCYYGIDMADRSELVAAGRSVEEIAALTGSASLAYLSLAGLQRALGRPAEGYCRACFTGDYPIPLPDSSLKLRFEPGAREPAGV